MQKCSSASVTVEISRRSGCVTEGRRAPAGPELEPAAAAAVRREVKEAEQGGEQQRASSLCWCISIEWGGRRRALEGGRAREGKGFRGTRDANQGRDR